MKKFFLRIYIFFQHCLRSCSWYCEYFWYSWHNQSVRKADDILKWQKYLIILPHSDDEWIGCSTIISDPRKDVVLCNADMPGGDSCSIHLIRRHEMESMACLYNRNFVTLSDNKVKALLNTIQCFHPDIILIPYWYDWHPEHTAVLDILYECLKLCKDEKLVIGMYQVTVPIPSQNINYISNMERKYWKHKWSTFQSNYKTQYQFSWRRVSLNECINGRLFSSFACEAFSVLNGEIWSKTYRTCRPSSEQQEHLKSRLGSIISLRTIEQPKYHVSG